MLTKRPRRDGQNGLTLIELLVVIVVLGILAGVVVFAVRGGDDKGKRAALASDERIVRTALEAYCARFGKYPGPPDSPDPMAELVDKKFLSEPSKYHKVVPTSGRCGGTGYDMRCLNDEPMPDCGLGTPAAWQSLSPSPPFTAQTNTARPSVQLLDGRILLARPPSHNGADRIPESYLYDPALAAAGNPWSGPSALAFGVANPTALGVGKLILLNPVAGGDCGSNCGKVFTHVRGVSSLLLSGGHYALFDPSSNGWMGDKTARYNRGLYGQTVRLTGGGDPGRCHPHCGKVFIMGQDFATENNFAYCPGQDCFGPGENFTYNPPVAELYDPAASRFDAVDCPYGPRNDFAAVGRSPVVVELSDGRVMALGAPRFDGPPRAVIFDPRAATVNNDLGTESGPTSCKSGQNPWTILTSPTDPDMPLLVHSAIKDDAVLLPDGKVFVTGELPANSSGAEAAVYDPTVNNGSRWTVLPARAAGNCSPPCNLNILALLPGGKVLVNMSSPRGQCCQEPYDRIASRKAAYLFVDLATGWQDTAPLHPDGKSGGVGAYIHPPPGACHSPGPECNYGKVLAVGDRQAALYTPAR